MEFDLTVTFGVFAAIIVAGVGAGTLERALPGRTAAALAEALDARVEWLAIGRSGAAGRYIAQHMLTEIEKARFDVIVVSAGVNDLISLHSLARWRKDLAALLHALSGRWPDAAIAFSGLPPMQCFPALPEPLRSLIGMRARQFDLVLRETIAACPQAIHLPLGFVADRQSFSGDGFHPSEASYATFGRIAADALAGHVDQPRSTS